jgi:hypothetical protein
MNINQITISSLLTLFVATSISAEPCLNCVATSYKKTNTLPVISTAYSKHEQSQMIPLEENIITEKISLNVDESNITENQENIILVKIENDDIQYYDSLNGQIEYYDKYDEDQEIIITDETQKMITPILYACDEHVTQELLCDSITQKCECV